MVVTREGRSLREVKIGQGDEEVQTFMYQVSKPWDVMYSTGNVVNAIITVWKNMLTRFIGGIIY